MSEAEGLRVLMEVLSGQPVTVDKRRIVSFFVFGIPAPGGSKRHIGKGRIVEDCKRTAGWRRQVAIACRHAMRGQPPLDGALSLSVVFFVPRPKDHWTSKGTLSAKGKATPHPVSKPDATKLVRSTEDALTGLAWGDDAQVITQTIHKIYCETPDQHPGAEITVQQVAGK